MPYDYGYIRRTTASDGMEFDCCLGKAYYSDLAIVMFRPDEPKGFLAYDSVGEALKAYQAGYTNDALSDLIGLTIFKNVGAFKAWLMQFPYARFLQTMSTIDKKWTGTYSAKRRDGGKVEFTATVEAPDHYAAGDLLKEKAEKKYGNDLYYPIIRWKEGPSRLSAGSLSQVIASGAGVEEE